MAIRVPDELEEPGKKVRFNLPKRGRQIQQPPETPFLGGPKAASRRHPLRE